METVIQGFFMNIFTKDDIIPISDYGYVIANRNIYQLKYKYSHAFVSAIVFNAELYKYNLSLDNISLDTTNYEVYHFIKCMPLIQISRIKVPEKVGYVYSLFINDTTALDIMFHILFNVYGADGSEEIDVNVTSNGRPITKINELKNWSLRWTN